MKILVAMLMCLSLLPISGSAIADNETEKKIVVPDTIVGAKELAGPHYIWKFNIPEKSGDKNAVDRLIKDEAVTPQAADRIKEVADQKVTP